MTRAAHLVFMPPGASWLLALQIGARLGTFVLNQVLVRTVSPAVFGAANVQLELVLSTVLALSREGTRALMLRRQDALRRGDPMLHNLALVPVWIGSVLSVAVGWVYVAYLAPAALWAQSGAAVPLSVALYGLGAWLELCAEPLHTHALGLDAYVSIRVAMEAGGLVAKAVVTAVLLQPPCLAAMQRRLASYVALSPMACALLAFAWGRVAYGATVLLVGVACVRGRPRRWWWPTSAAAVWGDAPTRAFLRVTTGQAALKLVLTEGEKLAAARLASLEEQGAYALASNYGSLVARMLFQPLEESVRLRLSQNAETAAWIGTLLRLHVLFGTGLVALAPPVAEPFLRLIAGPQWAHAAPILGMYCWYVPVLGINGVVEAFVQSVAPARVLRRYSYVLLASSGVMVGVLASPVAEARMVVANIASLGVRAVASSAYVWHVSRRHLDGLLPHGWVWGVLVACGAVVRAYPALFGLCTAASVAAVVVGERRALEQVLWVL